MPLTSVLAALGMLVGGVSFTSAQSTMIVLTSVLPLVVYLLAVETFRNRGVGLVAALLSTTFHLFLDKPSAPLSHAPFVVLASLSLWLIVRSTRDPRCLKWAGAAIALTQLARSDGIVLFGALAVAHLVTGRRPPWRSIAAVPLAYVLVMAPWWGHNLAVHGAPMPGGSFRAAFLRSYEQWYSLPESVTPRTWLADGWEPVLSDKLSMCRTNLGTAALGLTDGADMREGARAHPPLVALMALAWVGLVTTLRRRFAAFWTTWLLEWVFYSLVFTAVGAESFRTGMYAVYPSLVVCAAAGLLLITRRISGWVPGSWPRERVATVLVAVVGAWLVVGQLQFASQAMQRKVAASEDLNAAMRAVREQMIEPRRLGDAVLMAAREIHELHAITGMRCVMIPEEPGPVIREVARRYGVTHLLMTGDPARHARPALRDIDRNPHFEHLESGQIRGWRLHLYRIVD
jgi:hypothetical protein